MTIADKLRLIANNVQKVFDKGFTDGKQAEYDEFWDAYQENGSKKSYYYAFYGWKSPMFYPKYDIVFTNQSPSSCFSNLNYNGASYCDYNFDFTARLKKCDVILDTSNATNLGYLFTNMCSLSVPPMDARNCTSFVSMFSNSYIETVGEIWLSDTNTNQNFSNMFNGSSNERLENITFKGVIANNIDFKTCKNLSVGSLRSILNALSKNASVANGKAITFHTSHQAKIEADAECTSYASAATSAGWTIAYNS